MLKYNIIPKPNSYKTLEGTYTVSQSTEVLCDRSFVPAGNFITDYLKTKPVPGEGTIKFRKTDGMSPESYTLKLQARGLLFPLRTNAARFTAQLRSK